MRFISALIALGVVAVAQARVSTDPVEAFIAAEFPHSGAPGLAYAVVDGGETSTGARGEVLRGSGRPVTSGTPFLMGSVSKSFTALAVMQLVETRDVDLEAPVSRYLDVFAGRASGAVTIRQLLSHTSGYSTRQGNDASAARAQDGDDLQLQVARMAERAPAHEPETRWQYSNANYKILGAVIEAVSGLDYAAYVEAKILAPIGMDASYVSGGARHGETAVGHRPWFGSKRPLSGASARRVNGPAGGVVSTASDMALYLAMMMNGQDDVISAESKAAMLRPASAVSPHYGFGWSLDEEGGIAYHSGLTPGVETLATLSPTNGKGVVVLVNSNGGIGFGDNVRLISGISARALGRGREYAGNGWGPRSLYLTFVLLPVLFLVGIISVWPQRAGLRAKSGVVGGLSLWFPLPMSAALAWVSLWLIPQLFGVSLGTFRLYQPDLVVLLVATAVSSMLWALLRLAVAYSKRQQLTRSSAGIP